MLMFSRYPSLNYGNRIGYGMIGQDPESSGLLANPYIYEYENHPTISKKLPDIPN
jgi:hypothetical protein